jgi:holliday junction DNA helicase RuvA
MIGKLKGILDSIESDRIILDVSGVGYIVHCSNKSILKLPLVGEVASFLIHMQVKEDDMSLYGFSDLAEKEWFENLISVQGIGPRLALTILSALEPSELVQAIIEKSKETFKHISGVGPKLAERMFTELNKKSGQSSHLVSGTSISSQDEDNISDALIALTNLGYNRNEAYNTCRKIYKNNPDITINELIKSSLKELSQ